VGGRHGLAEVASKLIARFDADFPADTRAGKWRMFATPLAS